MKPNGPKPTGPGAFQICSSMSPFEPEKSFTPTGNSTTPDGKRARHRVIGNHTINGRRGIIRGQSYDRIRIFDDFFFFFGRFGQSAPGG